MSVLDNIAHLQGRSDEIPNQELAKQLAEKKDHAGVQEIADNLWNKDKNIQADCIKVMYEIGYRHPELIAPYVGHFLKLLTTKNNRLVWGAMIALSTVASVAAKKIFAKRADIVKAIESGSVITVDNGIKTLAITASQHPKYNKDLFPLLLERLRICRSKDVPQHSEHCLIAVNAENHEEFIRILEERKKEFTVSQLARVKKIIQKVSKAIDIMPIDNQQVFH